MRQMIALAQNKKYLKITLWLIAILLGVTQTWSNRYTVWPDAVSYLDIGDAYLRGEWSVAINECWSPLYSWLLGVPLFILKPSPYWEVSVIKLVNFLIYIFALACFNFFLSEIIFYYQVEISERSQSRIIFNIPDQIWLVAGHFLFIWSSLRWLIVYRDSPDMCVTALVYLATGIVLRVYTKSPSWLSFILLGIVLGLGYLAKSVMLPLAFVFLAVALFSVGNFRKAAPRILVALLVFIMISAPFVVALSVEKGHLTFGNAGKLNYAWYVSPGAPDFHWQGEPYGSGIPKHPTRKIFNNPGVYEFAKPIEATYPPWYDPSYWNEGLAPTFNLRAQIKTSLKNIAVCYELFLGNLVFGYLILVCMGDCFLPSIKALIANWRILIPAAAGLAIFILATTISGRLSSWGLLQLRYIAPFVVLLFAGVFTSVRFPDSKESKKLLISLTIFVLAIVSNDIFHQFGREIWTEFRTPAQHIQWQVANNLAQFGVQSGDKVAILGIAPDDGQYWARLAQVKVVSDIEDTESFWKADVTVMSEALRAVASTGAKVIVSIPTDGVQRSSLISRLGWKQVSNTNYYAYVLQK